MEKTTEIIPVRQPESVEDPLTEIARDGARRMLAAALRAEADAFVAQHAEEFLPDGRQRVVRHGYGPEHSILTAGSVRSTFSARRCATAPLMCRPRRRSASPRRSCRSRAGHGRHRHLQKPWRRQPAARAVPGRDRHDAPRSFDLAQDMGRTGCPPPWIEARDGRAGAPHRCHPASHVGRGCRLPCRWTGSEYGLRNRTPSGRPPHGGPSRSPQGRGSDDAVVRTVADTDRARQ